MLIRNKKKLKSDNAGLIINWLIKPNFMLIQINIKMNKLNGLRSLTKLINVVMCFDNTVTN